ncbi:MAG: aspartate aminotransferase family protein [Thermaerobacter sp.]|nr:aspartate aminotransferase family protein [Thermaerobacter sp.]
MSDVFYRSPSAHYPLIAGGAGIYLWDAEGRRYLDGSSGALVANLGHGRREIVDAMAQQAGSVAFAHTQRFTSAAQEALGHHVARLLPGDLSHTYPVSGGSEATETAIKLARQYFLEGGQSERYRVVTQWPSYHGNTLGALAASGHLARRRPYDPLLSAAAFVHAPQPRSDCRGRAAGGWCPCVAEVGATIERAGPETVAAILWEPISGSAASGFVPHPGFFTQLRKLCDRWGILLIVDEVMAGLGRTGRMLGVEHHAVDPDIVTLAKGLSGGYAPLGAVVATDRVYNAIAQGSGRFVHGFTFGGHPVACAAGAKALEILEAEDLVRRSALMGVQLARGLHALRARHPVVREVRGRGLMQGLVLETDRRVPGGRASQLGQRAFDRGLLIYPGSGEGASPYGDHVLIGPPLVITAEEVATLLMMLDDSLAALT